MMSHEQSSQRLVWIDLEMTGLDPEHDTILEIATVVTDTDLNLVAKGPELVVGHPQEILDNMNEWCVAQHGASGLTQAVRESEHTMRQAEQTSLSFLRTYLPAGVSPMCGNTIAQDRRFLRRYMPELEAYFHYRYFDVSTLKLAACYWRSEDHVYHKSEGNHRAMEDVLASIEEARFYKQMIQPA